MVVVGGEGYEDGGEYGCHVEHAGEAGQNCERREHGRLPWYGAVERWHRGGLSGLCAGTAPPLSALTARQWTQAMMSGRSVRWAICRPRLTLSSVPLQTVSSCSTETVPWYPAS
jgi:hypothetical protein